ncbi:MAG: sugar ABC transporter substrate-binding protein, partial [Cohaesibacteraceae bacterium]|nr:sugar ABC transporter substrate-binding protein [Cohaesibacteraceae bacterium]
MKKILSLMAATVLSVTAIAVPAYSAGEKFVLISHAPDSDSWWNTIKNAVKVAGDQMDVTVDY